MPKSRSNAARGPAAVATDASASSDGVAAVDRALCIARALAESGTPLTLADLGRHTGLYKSTLLRLLASLGRSGLVIHRANRHYALGPQAFLFGRAFEATNGLREVIEPALRWLVSHGTESPSFHVRHGAGTRLCVYRIDSDHSTLDRVRAGDILPLDKGAPGKVLSAYAQGLPTGTDPQLVFTSFGERDPLCGAIASPVFGPTGILLGALSMSGPLDRFSELAVQRMSSLLLSAAETASRGLGGQWPATASRPGPPADTDRVARNSLRQARTKAS